MNLSKKNILNELMLGRRELKTEIFLGFNMKIEDFVELAWGYFDRFGLTSNGLVSMTTIT